MTSSFKVCLSSLSMLLLLLLFFHPLKTNALSCIEPGSVLEEKEKAAAIFSGKATKVTEDTSREDMYRVAVEFEVYEVWKGDIKDTITVQDIAIWTYFKVGEEYLVYANISDGELHSSKCTLSKHLHETKEDIAVLGIGNTIKKATTKLIKEDTTRSSKEISNKDAIPSNKTSEKNRDIKEKPKDIVKSPTEETNPNIKPIDTQKDKETKEDTLDKKDNPNNEEDKQDKETPKEDGAVEKSQSKNLKSELQKASTPEKKKKKISIVFLFIPLLLTIIGGSGILLLKKSPEDTIDEEVEEEINGSDVVEKTEEQLLSTIDTEVDTENDTIEEITKEKE